MPQTSAYRRASPFVIDRNTVRFLLLPQPLLSTLDLLLVRPLNIEISWYTLSILGIFPLVAAIIAVAGLRSGYSRRRNWAILEISVVELISTTLLLIAMAE